MQYSHGYQSSYAQKILELVLLYYNTFKNSKKKSRFKAHRVAIYDPLGMNTPD